MYHIVVLTKIYCRFTIIDYTMYSFLSLKCVYIFLADPVYIYFTSISLYAEHNQDVKYMLILIMFLLSTIFILIKTTLPYNSHITNKSYLLAYHWK